MSDQPPRIDGPADLLGDPRVDADHLRVADVPDGDPVLVVGCVHDHPASVFRARTAVRTLAPAVVAVELPSLALGLFERVGRSAESDASPGGEMSAALAAGAAMGARRAGIDALDARFARALLSELRETSPGVATLRRVAGAVSGVGRHALRCRLSAALGPYGTTAPVTERAYDHEIDALAPADEQAADERRQLTRSLSVLRAFDRPLADDVVDAARERTMAAHLVDLARTGDVVAVVGFDHLSGVAESLAGRGVATREPDRDALARLWADGP